MTILLPKLKYLVSSHNNSSYKYVFALSLLYCFNGQKCYSFVELFRFVVPFYFNMAVRYKIVERASGKLPKLVQSIKNYSLKHGIDYVREKDFAYFCKENLKSFFACPVSCFEKTQDVSRFSGKNTFFEYSIKDKQIELTDEFYKLLSDKNQRELAKDVVFITLVGFLERYNSIPNLYSKISGGFQKRDLVQFKKIFQDTNSPFFTDECYICGSKLWNDVSIDHFVPFNYVACDEVWNLIPVHKSCNSYKGDKLGSKAAFEKLAKRNERLYEVETESPYLEFMQKALFDSYPTFEELYVKMIEEYSACSAVGYRGLKKVCGYDN